MSALTRKATSLATAMCRDAFGNFTAGQDARSLGFLAAAIKLLDAVKACEEAKSDFRAEAALQAAMTAALEATDKLPAFDDAFIQGGAERFEKLGLSSEGVLVQVDSAEMGAA
ncbi:hypothetical protein [Paraburkholderia elongata]|uniref:Uncharacterized protein n=1 Tax=Paraburkholderia elongata TaxID=2675747 RepID=A0A972NS64_9BURK|nr:hypothetical protein [Paraburkholderia elongata]NPT58111.1 hypothetical protein [Paraburkholderia elongata]